MWLAEAGSLRVLFDPLLDDLHHGGVFRVWPPRRVHPEALRADFILVSHRHPDHFDVPSLRRLAAIDPESVVVTPDPLVEEAARAVGFRTVHRTAPGQRVELDGLTLVTTPSQGSDEWGAALCDPSGLVWNMVDTTFSAPAAAKAVRDGLCRATGRPGVDLLLARWQPLREVDAALGGTLGFPLEAYGRTLDEVAGVGARAVVPTAAGVVHAAPYEAMNALVYPVPESRFLADVTARQPGLRAFPCRTGGCFTVDPDGCTLDPTGGASLVTVLPSGDDPRVFRPFGLGPLVDPGPVEALPALRDALDAWMCGAVRAALPTGGAPLRYVAEVVYPGGTRDAWTFLAGDGSCRVSRSFEPDWDLLVQCPASLLGDVLAGRRGWGDPLLGGMLRAASRAYGASPAGLRGRRRSPLFLYYALPYDESERRAVRWQLEGRGGGSRCGADAAGATELRRG